jgi:MvdC family ATP-grasp ribosomal peptide maturase
VTGEALVLVLTHSDDTFTIDRVADGLRLRGARPVRVDTDLFPAELSLAMGFDRDTTEHALTLAGETFCASDVRAIYNRRVWKPRLDPDLDETFREGCARESTATLRAFLSGLSHARWIDPPLTVTAAEDKPRQLREARAAGLTIPRTIITNDPARVRDFHRSLGGPMVTKMLSPLSYGMQASAFFVHTSLVDPGDLDDLDSLRLCPMVFQELIPKRIELRVIYVAGRCFTGSIDTSKSERAQVDWRRASPDEVRWERHELDPDVAVRLHTLMQRLGLAYGAADFIVTPEGHHVFLEVNPSGEWGMVEHDLGLPIGDALAAALVDGLTA